MAKGSGLRSGVPRSPALALASSPASAQRFAQFEDGLSDVKLTSIPDIGGQHEFALKEINVHEKGLEEFDVKRVTADGLREIKIR